MGCYEVSLAARPPELLGLVSLDQVLDAAGVILSMTVADDGSEPPLVSTTLVRVTTTWMGTGGSRVFSGSCSLNTRPWTDGSSPDYPRLMVERR
jgi:hypothetical protein